MSRQYDQNRRIPSQGGMIFKIVLGLLFIVVGTTVTDDPEWGLGETLFSVVIGGGFIAWGASTYLNRKRRLKELEDEQTAQILSAPLNKFGSFAETGGIEAERLARKYDNTGMPPAGGTGSGGGPDSGIDWNRDGELDWKDSAIEKEILRKEAANRGIRK